MTLPRAESFSSTLCILTESGREFLKCCSSCREGICNDSREGEGEGEEKGEAEEEGEEEGGVRSIYLVSGSIRHKKAMSVTYVENGGTQLNGVPHNSIWSTTQLNGVPHNSIWSTTQLNMEYHTAPIYALTYTQPANDSAATNGCIHHWNGV